jgi:Na+-translocating ferredoxin:NAD+ oxidoreductase RnfG subunit
MDQFKPYAFIAHIPLSNGPAFLGLLCSGQASSPFSFMKSLYAEVLITVDQALKTFFPKADEIQKEIITLTPEQKQRIETEAGVTLDPDFDQKFYFYAGKQDGKITGYAAANAVNGKWGPIYYMIQISPQGEIQDAMVLAYEEKRGRPVAKNRFLKQFFGKTKNNSLTLMKDIRGVTGATISSRGMTNGIRKLLHIFEMVYGGKK